MLVVKYRYAYKTSDGVRHTASIDASSREEVFAVLRKQGIKAIKVVAADGSKANGEIKEEGRRKKEKAFYAGIAAVLVLFALFVSFVFFVAETTPPSDPEVASPRHQIYGDPAIMEGFERGEFGEALPRHGDQLLAWFSQPGKLTCPKNTPPGELLRLSDANVAALQAIADSDVEIAESDSREVRELKQIVNGMRREMREYLANGNGTPRSYWRRLNERTQEEAQIYERTRRELEKETDPDVREEKNASLRRLGLRTIPKPKAE